MTSEYSIEFSIIFEKPCRRSKPARTLQSSVVPGALGAYRREFLEKEGFYDSDTIVEDFDITVKRLKVGKAIQASSEAYSYTEGPGSWKDLYLQRLRWYRGTLQTILKHKNVLNNPRFGYLYKLIFPYLLFSLIFLPLVGLVIVGSIVWGVLTGSALEIVQIFIFFNLIMALSSVLAIQMDHEDPKLTIYSPFLLMGYKHFLDLIKIKSVIDVFTKHSTEWTSPEKSE